MIKILSKLLVSLSFIFLYTSILSATEEPASFGGLSVPLITPFQIENPSHVDLKKFEELLEHYSHTPVDSLYIISGVGERERISLDNKKQMIDLAIKFQKYEKKILAGVTSPESTEETLLLAQYADKAGCDGIAVITPGFTREKQDLEDGVKKIKDQKLLLEYFSGVAESVHCSLVLCDQWLEVEVATFNTLQERFPNIVAIKISESEGIEHTKKMIQGSQGDAIVLAGFETQVYKAFKVGAKGAVVSGANLYPELLADLVSSCQKGYWRHASLLQFKVSYSWDRLSELGPWTNAIKHLIHKTRGITLPEMESNPLISEKNEAIERYFKELDQLYK
ncbi:MAG: 4-hydroxy-tetrahydrodipicolinate synthase [Chlamydiales bacterium]